MTSAGLWLTPPESSAQIALTPQGRVKRLSRERETPSDRGVEGAPPRRLSLPPPHSVDEEEKAFLTEVEASSQLDLLHQQQKAEEDRRDRSKRITDSSEPEGKVFYPSSSSAARAAAAAKVSLSESESEDDALAAIADAFVVPQWDDNSRVTEISNTLTALTLAGVPTHDTSMEDVVVSLRRIVTVTNSPAEAAADFL